MNNPSMNEGNSADRIYATFIEVMADVMLVVTAGHEQVGAVEAYVQDASFCAFKWAPGALIGTKQTATAQALLMSFTSTPMLKLLGDDWTHLFPEATRTVKSGTKTPRESFETFRADLLAFSKQCDARNEEAVSKPFPENFPLYVTNPKYLETGVSV